MGMVTIKPEKCTYCGVCIDDCPFHLLEMESTDSLPRAREIALKTAKERCINCGHCVVVCPTAALSISPVLHAPNAPVCQNPDDMAPLQAEWDIGAEQVDQLLKGRRTCRTYRDKLVPRETLGEIIEVASYSPSGHNNQLVNWIVISDKDEIRRIGQLVIDFLKANAEPNPDLSYPWDHLAADGDVIVDLWEKGEDSVFRGAPHLVMVTGAPETGLLFTGREQYAIRLSYLELAAFPRGIRTVWNGFFTVAYDLWPPVRENLGLPEGQALFDSMCLGYPVGINRVQRVPFRNKPQIEWR